MFSCRNRIRYSKYKVFYTIISRNTFAEISVLTLLSLNSKLNPIKSKIELPFPFYSPHIKEKQKWPSTAIKIKKSKTNINGKNTKNQPKQYFSNVSDGIVPMLAIFDHSLSSKSLHFLHKCRINFIFCLEQRKIWVLFQFVLKLFALK